MCRRSVGHRKQQETTSAANQMPKGSVCSRRPLHLASDDGRFALSAVSAKQKWQLRLESSP
jgi:hypothetical protein